MELLTQYEMQPLHVLMLSILVLYLGLYLNRKIRFLNEFYIPPAVTGGLICSIIVAVIYYAADLEIAFDMQIRDLLLLVFFSTIGLSAKLRTLRAGETQCQMISKQIDEDLIPRGTVVEEGKQTLVVDGITYLVETSIKADFALIKANRADYQGNLDYSLTAQNFNPLMAMAAGKVIAEAAAIAPVGVISPDAVRTPSVLVDHIVGRTG